MDHFVLRCQEKEDGGGEGETGKRSTRSGFTIRVGPKVIDAPVVLPCLSLVRLHRYWENKKNRSFPMLHNIFSFSRNRREPLRSDKFV